MDFLLADDDNLVSLEEALAFIDTCDVTPNGLPTDTPTFIHNSPLDPLDQLSYSDLLNTTVSLTPKNKRKAAPSRKKKQPTQEQEPSKKRRVRSANSSSTKLQQRKRAEIQALREQVHELESQVDVLKKNKFLPGDVVLELKVDMSETEDGTLVVKDVDKKAPSNWHEMAIAQYKERLLSEKTNRRLKSILSNQEKVNGSLHGLLQKRSVLHGMDYVFTSEPAQENPLLPSENSGEQSAVDCVDSSKEIVTELESAVQQLYQQYRNVYKPKKQKPAVSCDMKISHDVRRGKTIEFVTTTPMTCSVDEASDILWKELTTYREYPDKVYKYMRGSKPNTQEKHFEWTIRSPSGMLALDGLQFIQKFEEKERTVFVIAERMFLPSRGLQFRDECWMTVAPSGAGPSASSVVEIFLQLYMERDDGLGASPDDIASAQTIVMGSLSNTFRKAFQAQQNALMEKAGRIVVSSS